MLVRCNILTININKFHEFLAKESFGQLTNTSLYSFVFLETYNAEVSYINSNINYCLI